VLYPVAILVALGKLVARSDDGTSLFAGSGNAVALGSASCAGASGNVNGAKLVFDALFVGDAGAEPTNLVGKRSHLGSDFVGPLGAVTKGAKLVGCGIEAIP
jgi:hypothetical protein